MDFQDIEVLGMSLALPASKAPHIPEEHGRQKSAKAFGEMECQHLCMPHYCTMLDLMKPHL